MKVAPRVSVTLTCWRSSDASSTTGPRCSTPCAHYGHPWGKTRVFRASDNHDAAGPGAWRLDPSSGAPIGRQGGLPTRQRRSCSIRLLVRPHGKYVGRGSTGTRRDLSLVDRVREGVPGVMRSISDSNVVCARCSNRWASARPLRHHRIPVLPNPSWPRGWRAAEDRRAIEYERSGQGRAEPPGHLAVYQPSRVPR